MGKSSSKRKATWPKKLLWILLCAYYLLDPYIFIHGGEQCSKENKIKNFGDVYVYNIENTIWKKLFLLDSPSQRSCHSLSCIRNEFYLFGGYSYSESNALNDVWMLNCDNVIWNSSAFELPGAIWKSIKCSGQIPGPTRGHGSLSFDKFLVIFGGADTYWKGYNTLYLFDTGNII